MSAVTKQVALLRETAEMALGTLRGNKMRSALTVLGVVIGVTSIVGMTSLIRGFDTSLRDSINTLGPNTIMVARFSAVSLSAGASFQSVMRRPSLTVADMRAVEKLAGTAAIVDIWLGAGPPGPFTERVFYRGERTRPVAIARFIAPGRVELIEALGADTLIYVEAFGVSLVARQNERTSLIMGDAVGIEFDPRFLHIFSGDGNAVAVSK